MMICTASVDEQWPNGEMPLVVPGVWAANDRLINQVDQAVDFVNHVLRGHVSIRARRSSDRHYVRLHVSTQAVTPDSDAVGRQGGVQNLQCTVHSVIDPKPSVGALVRELCRALGVHHDHLTADGCSLTPGVIDSLKRLYP